MNRRIFVCLLLALLAACGSAPTSAPVTAPRDVPTAPAPDADGPRAVVQQALDRLATNDQPGLTAVFDPAMSEVLRGGAAMQAWNAWDTLQSAYNVGGIGGRGPIQQIAMQPTEPRSTDTLVPVLITYEHATTRWNFAVRETPDGWRVTDITRTTLEER